MIAQGFGEKSRDCREGGVETDAPGAVHDNWSVIASGGDRGDGRSQLAEKLAEYA